MRTILFVTWRGLLELADDDRLAAEELRRRGCRVLARAWDDRGVRWNRADAVVLRSCWDYHLRPAEFADWLGARQEDRTRLWNPAPLARWNADKRYLVSLAAAGLPVVPTEIVARNAASEIGAVLRRRGWNQAVVKPAIGASAFATHRIGPDDLASPRPPLPADRDLLVQPYVHEITSEGEWSLVFFAGRYSHAVRKWPAPGDFRVQHELGGSLERAEPPDTAVATAHRVLETIPHPWLYARVDGVNTRDGFLVIELEMLEPSLFLDQDPTAPTRFADAITGST